MSEAKLLPEAYKVTFWKSLKTPKGGQPVDLERVLNAIKAGGEFISIIKDIRKVAKLENTKENRHTKDQLKQMLPGVTFSGIFEERYIDKLIESNGLMCLDFDHTLEVPKELFIYTLATWVSASGDGRKVLIRIPIVKDDAQYKQYFAALEAKYKTLDRSGKDICRLTYLSYDPDIIINPAAKVYTHKIEASITAPTPAPPVQPAGGLSLKPDLENRLSPKGSVHQVQSNYAKLTLGIKMVQQAPIGNRHETILKAGRLLGGYIGGGELIEEDVIKVMEPEVLAIMDNPKDFVTQWKTFLDGIRYGKALPLKERERERKSMKAEFLAEDTFGDIYYTAADMESELEELYDKGWARGKTTGWPKFDNYYSVLPGFTSTLFGAPYTGKSYWCFNLLINMAQLHGDISVIFSPETGSARDVYAALIEIHAGADMTATYKNQMTKEQFKISKDFIDRHFLVLDTEQTDYQFTMESLLLYVGILEKKLNVKFHNVMIDPLIELVVDNDMRDDHFWNQTLRTARVQAKRNGWHVFLLTHIIKQTQIGRDDDGNNVYPIPTPFEIYSGQTFYRKGFQMLSFYRHMWDHEKYGPEMTLKILGNMLLQHNQLLITICKSKPKGVGKTGRVDFFYNPKTNRSYDERFGATSAAPPPQQMKMFEQKPLHDKLPYSDNKDGPMWVDN